MAENKMAVMAAMCRLCDDFTSENIQGRKLYTCTKFHACMKKVRDFTIWHLALREIVKFDDVHCV